MEENVKAFQKSDTVKMFIVYKDGNRDEIETAADKQIWPIAIYQNTLERAMCYPLFDGYASRNLYGRLMTLLEATIDNETKLSAVKDLFSRELRDFNNELIRSATEIAHGGESSNNIYSR